MSKLLVGYAKVDITPREPVYLTGWGNDHLRLSDNVLDPIYATCLAFGDESGATALIYSLDMLYSSEWMRYAVSEGLNIPVEQVQFSATHTHSAPAPWPTREPASNKEYLYGPFKAALLEAAEKALADRKPAEMYINETRVEGLNYVRHYLMADGTYSGPNFGNTDQPFVCHETEADNRLQLVKFVVEGGKDIIVASFGVHQVFTGGLDKYCISADSAGAMRAKMEWDLNCRFIYFTGAAGNINPTSEIKTEHSMEDHVEHGRALARYAIRANDSWQKVETGAVRIKTVDVDLEINHRLDAMEPFLREAVKLWVETGDRELCDRMCREKGLNSIYAAESGLGRMSLPPRENLNINVVSVGDVAFVMMPYEVFDTNAAFIKEHSPHKMSVIVTCANSVRNYIPSQLGFDHGGYSVDRCRYMPGTGELLADEFVAMLKEVHG